MKTLQKYYSYKKKLSINKKSKTIFENITRTHKLKEKSFVYIKSKSVIHYKNSLADTDNITVLKKQASNTL